MYLLKIASNSGSFSETSSHVLSLHRDTSVEKVAKEELPREKAPQSSAVLCVSGIYSPEDYPAGAPTWHPRACPSFGFVWD